MSALDLKLFYWINGLAGQNAIADKLFVFLAVYLPYLMIIAFLIFVWRQVSQQQKIQVLFNGAMATVLARYGVAGLIRYFYHRPRPFIIHAVNQLVAETSYSFPSGHASFFFALATIVYLYNKRWGVWFLISAALVSLGRVLVGVHYSTDVAAGAIIGIVVGYLVFWLTKRWQKSSVA